MIDTHAHLDFKDFDEDREEVISRFFDAGGKAIVNIGVDLERSRKSIEIAESHENVFASVGFHPEFFSKAEKEFSIFSAAADQFSKNSKINKLINELKKLANNKKVVAIGEIGLDYFSHTDEIITNEQKENQKKGFLVQIELAQELGLPVIVHCREAWRDLYEIVKSQSQNSNIQQNPKSQVSKKIQNTKYKIPDTKFVLHCYSGEKKDMENFLELPNVHFSFSGNITYPKPIERAEKLAEAVRMIPLDKIMLDSDSPFLAPQEFRGKRNEPTYVKYIAQKIADIKDISVEEVERVTDKNAEKFFGT
ncbi:MAG: TatD family hydrolase [Candidatus Moraniibacteriota bacterium]